MKEKPEVKIYRELYAKLRKSEFLQELETAFAELYPESFNIEACLGKRLASVPLYVTAVKKKAVADFERKQKHGVLFDHEKEKLEDVEVYYKKLEQDILDKHPEGFIK